MPVAAQNNDTLDVSNSIFQKAVAFVRDTNENLFLTGKAGTGKTTFLKYIKTQTTKPCAVIAPTGVAAMNAGGETIHSFLQLPFGPFVPGNAGGFGRQGEHTQDKHSLLANLRMRETKIKLINKLELLIIDEVSMVRADLLDAIDLVLRHLRKKWSAPFGGVQVIFIGDLFQLPPVAQQEEWEILSQYYASPYFFDAHVLRQNPLLYIELKKIYRQKEQGFIDILNRIRNGNVLQDDINTLNVRYDPLPQKEDGYIILCTHNRIADEINQKALEKLDTKLHSFEGVIKDDFNLKNLPTEKQLQLKTGAQVMFIKNDLQTPRRYYNGKIGVVKSIDNAGIWITFPGEDTSDALLLELETWKNMRYTLNKQRGSIEEEETGSFTQYPIRLAWAITVHKSQGLTLQKAIVDLNQSFASGQVYVALSRCTSLDGLALRSKLQISNVIVDERIVQFAQSENEEDELEEILEQSKRQAAALQMSKTFSFAELIAAALQLRTEFLKRKTGPREENLRLQDRITETLSIAQTHAEKFQKQLEGLIVSGNEEQLQQRQAAAVTYFTEQVINKCLRSIEEHIVVLNTFPKVAKQLKTWNEFITQLKQKEKEFQKIIVPHP